MDNRPGTFKWPAHMALLAFAILCGVVLCLFNGTADSGDSIRHYLGARFAPEHPIQFFSHWDKPVYVLLGTGFAQLGMVGIKGFNVLMALLGAWATWRTARARGIVADWLAVPFSFAAPFAFVCYFSGLTEPLFASWSAISLMLWYTGNRKSAAGWVSFLPFVRTEGLIIAGVFALALLLRKEWRTLPRLALGTVLYSLVGGYFYGDLLWVIHQNPYATLQSVYGKGGLLHFADAMPYIIGIPLTLLVALSIPLVLVKYLQNRPWKLVEAEGKWDDLVLIYGGAMAFFVAHSLFWYLGIFNSMGLKRVIVGILPMLVLMAMDVLHFMRNIQARLFKHFGKILATLITLWVLVFPVIPNPAALKITDLELQPDQRLAVEVAGWMREHGIETKGHICYMAMMQLAVELDIDIFDQQAFSLLYYMFPGPIPGGSLVIWDNWYSVVESRVTLEELQAVDGLKEISRFSRDCGECTCEIVLFRMEQDSVAVQPHP